MRPRHPTLRERRSGFAFVDAFPTAHLCPRTGSCSGKRAYVQDASGKCNGVLVANEWHRFQL